MVRRVCGIPSRYHADASVEYRGYPRSPADRTGECQPPRPRRRRPVQLRAYLLLRVFSCPRFILQPVRGRDPGDVGLLLHPPDQPRNHGLLRGDRRPGRARGRLGCALDRHPAIERRDAAPTARNRHASTRRYRPVPSGRQPRGLRSSRLEDRQGSHTGSGEFCPGRAKWARRARCDVQGLRLRSGDPSECKARGMPFRRYNRFSCGAGIRARRPNGASCQLATLSGDVASELERPG